MKKHIIKHLIEVVGIYYGVDFLPIIDVTTLTILKIKNRYDL